MSEKLDRLSEPFPIEDVKQRRQGGRDLDYISIDATIRRLNDVLELGWSFEIDTTQLLPMEGGKYLALVQGKIIIPETADSPIKIASGVGSDVATDPDKAIKTALAEALKKAGHQLGIGLYLWEESEREVVAKQRAANASRTKTPPKTDPKQEAWDNAGLTEGSF